MRIVRGALIAAVAAGLMGIGLTPTAVATSDSGSSRSEAKASVPWKHRVLDIQWEQEEKGYWCGPAAARMALSSWVDNPMSQSALADLMTDWIPPWAGTPNVGRATDAMNLAIANSDLADDPYTSRSFPPGSPEAATAIFRRDVRHSIGHHSRAMVVNVRSTKFLKLHPAYPDRDVFHYVTVYGYSNNAERVYIADPASGMNDDYADVPKRYSISAKRLIFLMWDGDDSDLFYSTMK